MPSLLSTVMNTVGGGVLSLEKFPSASLGTSATRWDHRHALNDSRAIHSSTLFDIPL